MEMERPIGAGLEQIKALILKMGKLSMDSISLAVEGFKEMRDEHLQVRAWSNTLLILSVEVEDRATELIALHQPAADDLRHIRAYIKVAYDMERFGRYALDISYIVTRLGTWTPLSDSHLKLEPMANKAKEIVSLAMELTRTPEQDLIGKISEVEAQIDELYLGNLKTLTNSAGADTRTIMANTLMIRYLERIADHASYVAESITYAETGRRIELR